MDFDTRAVRAARGRRIHAPSFGPDAGVPHVPPIDLSTTYGFESTHVVAESMDALAAGASDPPNPVYARLHNPTVAGFEVALADLEGAESAVAFASGMAAIAAVLLAAATSEDGVRRPHVVAVRPVYGGTDHLLGSEMLGSEVTWAESWEIEAALRPDTGLVLLESPANPTLTLVDVRAVVEQVRSREAALGHRVLVGVDSTFATPVLQNPIALGADLAIHSATKFLGGHGDVLGGVVATAEPCAAALRRIRSATGGVLHPLAGYLLHRGLQTLPLRVRAQQESARVLAGRLPGHPAVQAVHFPGATGDPIEHRLLATQQRGPGSVLSFRVSGGADGARRVVESLNLVTPAVSLGSVDTLIQPPALLTHRFVDAAAREASGVPDDLLRLSVGLEAVDDLWADLEQALAGLLRHAA